MDSKKPRQNVLWRTKLYHRANGDIGFQNQLREMCRQDLLFYINAFIWQYDPLHIGNETGPFITWDFQDEACRTILNCIHCECHGAKPHGHDLMIEKSREVGASWLCLIIMEWLWHFFPLKQFLMDAARREDSMRAKKIKEPVRCPQCTKILTSPPQ